MASKESEIEDKYDKGHENDDTERKKKHRRCNRKILLVGTITIIGILAVLAIAMSGYSLYQVNTAQPKHDPLTDKDWITVHKFIAAEVRSGIQEGLSPHLDEFNKTLGSFSNRLADLELQQNVTNSETQALHAQLRDLRESSERYQNKTSFVILQLSMQVNNSTEQIEKLHEEMRKTKSELGELFEQQNSTQRQTDELRLDVYQLEESQIQTVVELEELRDDVNETRAMIIELSSELTELQNSLPSKIAEQTAPLKALINSTEIQLRADLEFFVTETRENITILRYSN